MLELLLLGDAIIGGGRSNCSMTLKVSLGRGDRSRGGGGGNSRSAKVGCNGLEGLAVLKVEVLQTRKVFKPTLSLLFFLAATALLRGEFGGW